MSTESRKLRAILLASTYALDKCVTRHPGHTISWKHIDKSELQEDIPNNFGYISLILDDNSGKEPAVRYIAIRDGISDNLRTFCEYIDMLKVPGLSFKTLYPSSEYQIVMYYMKGVLCLHYPDEGNPDHQEPAVELYIMSKTEILKLRMLADQIEKLNFFILE